VNLPFASANRSSADADAAPSISSTPKISFENVRILRDIRLGQSHRRWNSHSSSIPQAMQIGSSNNTTESYYSSYILYALLALDNVGLIFFFDYTSFRNFLINTWILFTKKKKHDSISYWIIAIFLWTYYAKKSYLGKFNIVYRTLNLHASSDIQIFHTDECVPAKIIIHKDTKRFAKKKKK
jgi:hypothetical protein